jgi:hypothetical protein
MLRTELCFFFIYLSLPALSAFQIISSRTTPFRVCKSLMIFSRKPPEPLPSKPNKITRTSIVFNTDRGSLFGFSLASPFNDGFSSPKTEMSGEKIAFEGEHKEKPCYSGVARRNETKLIFISSLSGALDRSIASYIMCPREMEKRALIAAEMEMREGERIRGFTSYLSPRIHFDCDETLNRISMASRDCGRPDTLMVDGALLHFTQSPRIPAG